MQGYDSQLALDIYEAIPEDFQPLEGTGTKVVFEHRGVTWTIEDDPDDTTVTITAKAPFGHTWEEFLPLLVMEFLGTYFSETTNDDACEVKLTHKSAHHDDEFDGHFITATVTDYLT